MDKLGNGPEVYRLIHGDLGMGANVLFRNKDVRLIDFDDSGFVYYLYDLSIVLEDSKDHQSVFKIPHQAHPPVKSMEGRKLDERFSLSRKKNL